AQQIPADTLADRGVRSEAVRLLTAHRSKGLEWRLVVVAHVQEDGWPDLRRRGSLLQADRIGEDGLQPPLSVRESLMEERRLFYVACTRARQRLVVTAVASQDDDGEQPSRFLAELGVNERHRQGRPARPLSLAGIVAELRRTVADPEQPEPLRTAAAHRLARLAGERAGGRTIAPQADPATWWGTRAATASEAPLRPADQPLTISASALTSLLTCPARWFLEREAGGASASTAAQGFGLVVHAIAERMARGELSDDPAEVDSLMEHVDGVWGQMSFRTPWSSSRERAEVRDALARFVTWQARPDARTLLATERELRAEVTLPDGQRVVVHGFADRLEIDDDGRVVVVDLKTGKYPPTNDEVREHPQLGLYQYAVAQGAVDDLLEEPATPGGAELVHLRKEVKGAVKTQAQPAQEPDADGNTLVEVQLMSAAETLRSERLPARSGSHCDTCDFIAICPVKGAGTVLS
uniref:PD-(D/E)XK nuclease family protein n=1 Tax=Nocardioides sp. TaxID=35761 RepID=UPI00356ADB7D